jgi:hypothetical protein
VSLDPIIGERAAALNAYWVKTGFPADHNAVMRLHAAIKDRLANDYGTRWLELLDDAMTDPT